MTWRTRLHVSWCFLGGLLLGSTALGQQDPRAVVIQPSTAAKSGDVRTSRAPARRATVAKRYWADSAGKAIRRSNLDGSNVETVASNVSGPYGVTYDQTTDSVVWTNSQAEVVQMAPADGSGETITLNSSFEEHFAIVVGGSTQNVAYGVEGAQVIRIIQDRNTGAERRDVLYTLPAPEQVHGMALAPDNSALFLGDASGTMTQKLNLSTLQMEPLPQDTSLRATVEPAPASSSRPASTEKTR
jgi:hypothetical protein